jgi:4,5-dihydroxyphthalate decarboxylase
MNSSAPLHFGARHWDHLVPLALGDVVGAGRIAVRFLESTPQLQEEGELAAAETSLSSYVRLRASGDRSITALPVFIMRGFRHRCIITRKTAHFQTGADLRGARIGLTGWPDSGNVWTRAVLRREGVGIGDAEWRVGALTADHPRLDRLGGMLVPDNVAVAENDEPLVDMLTKGALDAVMTPFMPRGFSDFDSPFRTLFPRVREAEAEYFVEVGYIPGIHVLTVKTSVLETEPDVAQLLIDALSASQELARERREKLLDVTPWQNEAFEVSATTFGNDFSPIGFTDNRRMIADFQTELVDQGIIETSVPEDDLFPLPLEPARRALV